MPGTDGDDLLARLERLRQPSTQSEKLDGVSSSSVQASQNERDMNYTSGKGEGDRIARLGPTIITKDVPKTSDEELDERVARFLAASASSPPQSPIRKTASPRRTVGGGSDTIVDPSIEIQFFAPPSTDRSIEEEEELIRKLQDELDVEGAHDSIEAKGGDVETTFEKLQRDLKELRMLQDPENSKLEDELGVRLDDHEEEEMQRRLDQLEMLDVSGSEGKKKELGPPPSVGSLDELRKSIGKR